ncbi:MAG: hypothetical protein GY798_25715 [Hyphomicrobiales bacterium]|nr:hypothetical protein [Hyphomicrobiales bacterium]
MNAAYRNSSDEHKWFKRCLIGLEEDEPRQSECREISAKGSAPRQDAAGYPRLAGVVIFAAIATAGDDPTLAVIFRERYVFPWRDSAARAIRRGIERGDLPAERCAIPARRDRWHCLAANPGHARTNDRGPGRQASRPPASRSRYPAETPRRQG